MKVFTGRWMAVCLLLLCGGFAELVVAAESVNSNMIGLTTTNGRVAYDFIDLWLNKGKGGEAFDKYVSRQDYFNHMGAVLERKGSGPAGGPGSPPAGPPPMPPLGKMTFEQQREMAASMKMPPGAHMEFKQLVAQGDLVFAHLHGFRNTADKFGNELVIILRIRDGKVVDHWDLHVDLMEGATIFEGLDRFERK